MRARILTLIVLAFVAGGCREQSEPVNGHEFLSRRIALLEEENIRLRALVENQQVTQAAADESEIRKTVEQQVAEIRGLDYRHPVKYEQLRRENLEEVILSKIDEHYSPEEMARVQQGYIALGLLPEGFDLRSAYVELLGEQIAAFYDQFTDTLFTFENTPLRKAMNRMILAHELTHALQDQHFSLENFPLLTKDNDDLVMATSALIEGDATMVMTDYLTRIAGETSPAELIGAALAQNTDALAKAPRYLREGLTFSYVQGQKFVASIMARGGYRAVDAAYALPPKSTAQILRPELYLAAPGEAPPRLEWQGADRSQVIADNVLGEFGWRTFLSEHGMSEGVDEACAGWRTDRFLILDVAEPKPAVLAWTVWFSGEEADAFTAALETTARTRFANGERHYKIIRPEPEQVVYVESGAPESMERLGSISAVIQP